MINKKGLFIFLWSFSLFIVYLALPALLEGKVGTIEIYKLHLLMALVTFVEGMIFALICINEYKTALCIVAITLLVVVVFGYKGINEINKNWGWFLTKDSSVDAVTGMVVRYPTSQPVNVPILMDD